MSCVLSRETIFLLSRPDLYNYFKATYTTEYYDNIHPNGLGYQGLANQSFNALTQ